MHNMDYRENIDSHLLDKFKALLLQGKSAEDILSSEGSLYKLTKDPDTYESYARYYNHCNFYIWSLEIVFKKKNLN